MQARSSTRHNSTPATAAACRLHQVARHTYHDGAVATAPPPPPLSRLQRLVSWLGILVCTCPACRMPREHQPATGWEYFRL